MRAAHMLSALEMRTPDRNAEHFGVSILELMGNAGKTVADVARKEFGAGGKRVLVVCGTGNNGGDGVGAARAAAGPDRDKGSESELRPPRGSASPRGPRRERARDGPRGPDHRRAPRDRGRGR